MYSAQSISLDVNGGTAQHRHLEKAALTS